MLRSGADFNTMISAEDRQRNSDCNGHARRFFRERRHAQYQCQRSQSSKKMLRTCFLERTAFSVGKAEVIKEHSYQKRD